MPLKPARGESEALRRISPFIKSVAGIKGWKIVESIGEGTTDDKIEVKTKFKMAEIRSLLNVLHNHGIVEYGREKNLQTGWFTYTWRVNSDRALKNFVALKKREYSGLKQRLSSEENTVFYTCRKACRKHSFDIALKNEFRCPSCSGKLNTADNAGEIRDCRTRIAEVQNLLLKMGELPPV
ncbi:MAG: hypothetical protein V1717_03840 [Candidatus Micrarchaeota archaeon]